MPNDPLTHAFSLIRSSLARFHPDKMWPTDMVELQRFVFEEHPDLVGQSPALQWATKAVQPWPTTENWRQSERVEFLRKAAQSADQEEAFLVRSPGGRVSSAVQSDSYNSCLGTEQEYQAALAEIEGLMNAEAGTPEGDLLDTLVALVEAYEAKHYPIEKPCRPWG